MRETHYAKNARNFVHPPPSMHRKFLLNHWSLPGLARPPPSSLGIGATPRTCWTPSLLRHVALPPSRLLPPLRRLVTRP